LAAEKGLRLIVINRRDYAPTTLLDESELKQVSSADPVVREAFLRDRGIEFALFTDQLIDELSLPPPTEDGKNGGLAWMGWSLGTPFPVAAVAAGAALPETIKKRVQSYLRRLIILDCPTQALGLKQPPEAYIPLFDEEIPVHLRDSIFADWVSSYFSHKNIHSGDLEYRIPDQSRKGSVASMTPEQIAEYIDPQPALRSENYLLTTFQPQFLETTKRAIFDYTVRESWPDMKVWVLYGDAAPWAVPYAASELMRMAIEIRNEELFSTHILPGANRFSFWDNPPQAIDGYLYCMEN